MAIKNHINLFLVLLMLGAQLALAQHATVHFTDHGHVSSSHHKQNDGTPKAAELCQLCIFSKGFAYIITPDVFILPDRVYRTAYKVPFADSHIKQQIAHGYLARGPPSFLI